MAIVVWVIMDSILAVNGISLKLYFKTLQPLEFIETDNAVTNEAREEETGVKLSKEEPSDDELLKMLDGLGESEEDLLEEGWELFDERPVDYDQEDALDKMLSLASVVPSRPRANSELDGETETGKRVLLIVNLQLLGNLVTIFFYILVVLIANITGLERPIYLEMI